MREKCNFLRIRVVFRGERGEILKTSKVGFIQFFIFINNQ